LAFSGGMVATGEGAGEDAHADAAFVQILGDGQDVFDRPAEAVEFPDAERVAGSQVVQCRGEAGAVSGAGGDLLLEDAAAAGLGEGVALELEVLAVGGHAGQAGKVVMGARHGDYCRRTRLTSPASRPDVVRRVVDAVSV